MVTSLTTALENLDKELYKYANVFNVEHKVNEFVKDPTNARACEAMAALCGFITASDRGFETNARERG